MEMEKSDASGSVSVKEKSDASGSVSVKDRSGAGLPYAPVDWPSPGDVWTWKLGKRVCPDGFYRDRRLRLPQRLQQKGKMNEFNSKKSVITYLQSEFPGTDVDAFFKSFTWKVPLNFNSSREKVCRNIQSTVDKRGALSSGELHNLAQVTPRSEKVHPQNESEKIGESKLKRRSWRLVMSKASLKKRIRFSPKEVKDVIDLSSWNNGTESCVSKADNPRSATDPEIIGASSSQNTGSQSSKDGTFSHSPQEIPSESIPNDSDKLIHSVDNFLSQSLPKSSYVGSIQVPVNDQSATSQEKIFEARSKLLSLLATNNPVLLSSIKLPEFLQLSSLNKTDPNIDANRREILKLIDEIPLAGKEFEEYKKISEAAHKFSEDLDTNIALATKLKNEYNESKGQEINLHKELDSISLYMEKIDEQISALHSRRAYLVSIADVKKKVADMLISKQKNAAECLSKVVDKVEMGKMQRQEWELKKKMSEEQKVNILFKFYPLRDFFL